MSVLGVIFPAQLRSTKQSTHFFGVEVRVTDGLTVEQQHGHLETEAAREQRVAIDIEDLDRGVAIRTELPQFGEHLLAELAPCARDQLKADCRAHRAATWTTITVIANPPVSADVPRWLRRSPAWSNER